MSVPNVLVNTLSNDLVSFVPIAVSSTTSTGWVVDALIVGYYDRRRLRYAGKVRAGFTPHVRREVFQALHGFETATCPFVDLPSSKASRWGGGITAEQMREMQWLKPKVVAQIRFVEWTAEGHLRHAAFLGLRSDKRPGDVMRES